MTLGKSVKWDIKKATSDRGAAANQAYWSCTHSHWETPENEEDEQIFVEGVYNLIYNNINLVVRRLILDPPVKDGLVEGIIRSFTEYAPPKNDKKAWKDQFWGLKGLYDRQNG